MQLIFFDLSLIEKTIKPNNSYFYSVGDVVRDFILFKSVC